MPRGGEGSDLRRWGDFHTPLLRDHAFAAATIEGQECGSASQRKRIKRCWSLYGHNITSCSCCGHEQAHHLHVNLAHAAYQYRSSLEITNKLRLQLGHTGAAR